MGWIGLDDTDSLEGGCTTWDFHKLLTLIEGFGSQIFMTGTTKNLFSFLSTNTNFCNISNK